MRIALFRDITEKSAHPSLQPRGPCARCINGAAVIAGGSRLPRHALALDLIIAGHTRNSHSRQVAAVTWPAIGHSWHSRGERASRQTGRAGFAWGSAGIHAWESTSIPGSFGFPFTLSLPEKSPTIISHDKVTRCRERRLRSVSRGYDELGAHPYSCVESVLTISSHRYSLLPPPLAPTASMCVHMYAAAGRRVKRLISVKQAF